ncbi:MAG: RNA polymerase sigma factor [Pseudobacter sp.]|uniref:RNA polymerase sigma factor n=1 Tax=Pseudobacter sp. TaxID=2045420 RepID=UPI003F7D0E8B
MDNKTHHERDLIRLLKLGDEAAMKEIFRLYYPRLHYFSSKITGNLQQAEDIVQEALLNFWLNVSGKDIVPENIQAYLYRMVRNRCINYLERQQLLAQKEESVIRHTQEQWQQQMDELALREEVYHRVSSQFHHLTPVQVQVVQLLYNEGLSVAEAAERLNTTDNNIRNHKARAIERLRKVLTGELFVFFIYFFSISCDETPSSTDIYLKDAAHGNSTTYSSYHSEAAQPAGIN